MSFCPLPLDQTGFFCICGSCCDEKLRCQACGAPHPKVKRDGVLFVPKSCPLACVSSVFDVRCAFLLSRSSWDGWTLHGQRLWHNLEYAAVTTSVRGTRCVVASAVSCTRVPILGEGSLASFVAGNLRSLLKGDGRELQVSGEAGSVRPASIDGEVASATHPSIWRWTQTG